MNKNAGTLIECNHTGCSWTTTKGTHSLAMHVGRMHGNQTARQRAIQARKAGRLGGLKKQAHRALEMDMAPGEGITQKPKRKYTRRTQSPQNNHNGTQSTSFTLNYCPGCGFNLGAFSQIAALSQHFNP
jgi:hypothetical protein